VRRKYCDDALASHGGGNGRGAFVALDAFVAWPKMDEAAYHGLAGNVVRAIAPHTEADPVAILIQVLVYFGNVVGRAPYYLVEADEHHANLYAVLVGDSSKSRKGTSGSRARSVFTKADELWAADRIKGGLSSGEGFIDPIRDEVKRWNAKEKQFEVIDPGVADKRLMVVEAEFAGALAAMERTGEYAFLDGSQGLGRARPGNHDSKFAPEGHGTAYLNCRARDRGRAPGRAYPDRCGQRFRE
jgi:hypothetical protein